MYFQLGSDHQLLQNTARRFVEERVLTRGIRSTIGTSERFDRRAWQTGVAMGWMEMLGDDSLGEPGAVGLGVIVQELGRALYSGPVISSAVVMAALSDADTEEAHVSAEIASGARIATASWTALAGPAGASMLEKGEDGTVSGRIWPVPDADISDLVLLPITDGSRSVRCLFDLGTRGIATTALEGLDLTRRYFELELESVPIEAAIASGVEGSQDRVGAMVAALLCAESVGVAERAFEIALEYVKNRKAFGRSIGSFQAIKHRMAQMLLWLESSKAATLAALRDVESGAHAPDDVAVARAFVSEHLPEIVRECTQFLGGIGFTWEHDMHLYLRRIETNASLLGGIVPLDRVAEALYGE